MILNKPSIFGEQNSQVFKFFNHFDIFIFYCKQYIIRPRIPAKTDNFCFVNVNLQSPYLAVTSKSIKQILKVINIITYHRRIVCIKIKSNLTNSRAVSSGISKFTPLKSSLKDTSQRHLGK